MSEQEITSIKINMEGLSRDLSYIKETLVAHINKEDEHLSKFIEAIDRFSENAEKKFAGKWLETLVVRLGWIIMTPLVGGACYGIWQMIRHVIVK
jgi:hypothetical protein